MGSNPAHPLHHRCEVDLDITRNADSNVRGRANVGDRPARPDDRLGRHAAHVETVAAHEVAFHEGDPGPHGTGAACGHQSGCPGTDHHQVVAAVRGRILPVGWVDVVNKREVVLIRRRHAECWVNCGIGRPVGFHCQPSLLWCRGRIPLRSAISHWTCLMSAVVGSASGGGYLTEHNGPGRQP